MSGQDGIRIRGGDVRLGSGITIGGGDIGGPNMGVRGGTVTFNPLIIVAFLLIPLVFFGAIFYLFVDSELWFICLPFILVAVVVMVVLVVVFAVQRKKAQYRPPPPPPTYPPSQIYPPPSPPPPVQPQLFKQSSAQPPPPPHMPHEPISYAPSAVPKQKAIKCHVCGNKFTPEATFCSNCGTKR
jgi:hypothetical protein